MTKKVFIRTLGCQMNSRDSEVICGLLAKEGYKLTADPRGADIILFNTCSVRQHAEDKVWSEIGRIAKTSPHDLAHKKRQIKAEGTSRPTKIVGLVGCMAQNYGQDVFRRAPQVDFAVGPSDIAKIPEIIAKIGRVPKERGESLFLRKIWETDGDARPDEIYHSGFHEDKNHAYVVISEGCSNYCSYCLVPFVRGELRNRNYKDILKEIQEAVDRGITKITLLGQNVNAYEFTGKIGRVPKERGESLFFTGDRGQIKFMDLLKLVNQIKGLREFSFITSHPRDTTAELFRAMAELEKLKKCLHLPVQAGSDRILKMMNRGYTKKFYLDLADNYRKIVKGGILTTDIIVGFPNEREEDFKDSYNLVKDIEFDAAYIFKYSPRPHTASAGLTDNVPKEEKERRHRLILELQKEISRKKNAKP